MQHAASRDNPLIGGTLERLYMEGKVLLQLLLQSVIDVARSHILAFLAEERRVVDGEEHRHGWLVNGNRRQWLGVLDVTDGIANLKLLQSDDSTNIAALHFVCTHMSHTLERVQLFDFCLLH